MAHTAKTSDDVALGVTLAVVSGSPAPLLLLDGDITIIAASESFAETFDGGSQALEGQPLYALEGGAWDTSELRALMSEATSADAPSGPREMDLIRPGRPTRSLLVQARRLSYLDLAETRIFLAVSDVTDARAEAETRERVARQNQILLQEARHRIANSLQIVASVLLQEARQSASEETRILLADAHNRVMSVAAVERILSTSTSGNVEMHSYFSSLSNNIAASLIDASQKVSLSVEGGEATIDARLSVSLGLIVTELVINALKHAFPDRRHGSIQVGYAFQGPNWVLSVRDDGVGMPPRGSDVRTGLGTSIVAALARQLDASVEVSSANPGTKVSVRHTQVALAQGLVGRARTSGPDKATHSAANG